MAVFLTCLIETEIFLLMRLNIESYRGNFQFPCTLAFCLLWQCGGILCCWSSGNSPRDFFLCLLSVLGINWGRSPSRTCAARQVSFWSSVRNFFFFFNISRITHCKAKITPNAVMISLMTGITNSNYSILVKPHHLMVHGTYHIILV